MQPLPAIRCYLKPLLFLLLFVRFWLFADCFQLHCYSYCYMFAFGCHLPILLTFNLSLFLCNRYLLFAVILKPLLFLLLYVRFWLFAECLQLHCYSYCYMFAFGCLMIVSNYIL